MRASWHSTITWPRRAGAAPAAGTACMPRAGMVTVKALPTSGTLATAMLPPISSHRRAQIDSPSPVPPKRLALAPSPCTNGWNARSISAGGMPMPESLTRQTSCGTPRSLATSSPLRAMRPLVVNLKALLSRLLNTCSRRVRSPVMSTSSDGDRCRLMRSGRPAVIGA
ncbi:hypothetical protein D9M70_363170 [compost metagenome]